MAIEWTEAHRREALRLLLRRAESTAGRIPVDIVREVRIGRRAFATESGFRKHLANGATDREIEAAVRRVDALATGRLVRSVVWYVRLSPHGGVHECASEHAARVRARAERNRWPWTRVLRVTRIRRAT